MTRSFYWYQNICPCDLGLCWNWPSSGAFVFHKHILFVSFGGFFMGRHGRPIIWNKNLRSLCVSAGWMYILTLGKPRPIRTSSRLDVVYGICQGLPSDILSIYIMIYFNGQYWLYTWYFILYVKKFGGFFNICCSFMLCNTHVTCYLYRSLCMIY